MKEKILKIATYILLLSAILHLSMPLLHGNNSQTLPAAITGAIYLILALGMIFTDKRWISLAAAIMTTIGLSAASAQWGQVTNHYSLEIVFIILNLIMAPAFWYSMIKFRNQES